MKSILLALSLSLTLVSCATSPTRTSSTQGKWPPPFREASLFNLSSKEAVSLGKRYAKEDFDAGHYRLLCYGLWLGPLPEETRLYHKYGISIEPVASCEVTQGVTSGADAYNTMMRSLLVQKFGTDIFR